MASAFKKRRSSAVVVRRSGPSPRLVKLEARLANSTRRAGLAAKDKELGFVAIGSAGLLALIEKKGKVLPTVLGLDPALFLGSLAFLFGNKLMPGKNGKRLEAAGEGWLAVAANRSVLRGSMKMAGDEDDGDDEDDDE